MATSSFFEFDLQRKYERIKEQQRMAEKGIVEDKKRVVQVIKLYAPAGVAKSGAPLSPILGQHGLNVADFCKEFNKLTVDMDSRLIVPVFLSKRADRTFDLRLRPVFITFYLSYYRSLHPRSKADDPRYRISTVRLRQLILTKWLEMARTFANSIVRFTAPGVAKTILGTVKSAHVYAKRLLQFFTMGRVLLNFARRRREKLRFKKAYVFRSSRWTLAQHFHFQRHWILGLRRRHLPGDLLRSFRIQEGFGLKSYSILLSVFPERGGFTQQLRRFLIQNSYEYYFLPQRFLHQWRLLGLAEPTHVGFQKGSFMLCLFFSGFSDLATLLEHAWFKGQLNRTILPLVVRPLGQPWIPWSPLARRWPLLANLRSPSVGPLLAWRRRWQIFLLGWVLGCKFKLLPVLPIFPFTCRLLINWAVLIEVLAVFPKSTITLPGI